MTDLGQNRSAAFTHVCMDCGALGVAGGYHDHGGGNVGETVALAKLPELVDAFQRLESECDEHRAEAARLRARVRQQWRCCAKDTGDGTYDEGAWRSSFEAASADLKVMLDAEPPYDENWIETRWVSEPQRVTAEGCNAT